jgi:hypothetical protein
MGPRLSLGRAVVWRGCGGVVAGSRLIGLKSDCVALAVVQVAVVEDAAHLVCAVCSGMHGVCMLHVCMWEVCGMMRCAYGAQCGMRAVIQGGARP